MFRVLLLIFDPAGSWERIETARPSVARVFFTYVLPIMLLSFAIEGWLISRLGTQGGNFARRLVRVSEDLLVRYEVAQFAFGLVICFVGAWLVQQLAQSFHRRHTYAECFTILGYSMGPYFLCRMLDGWPVVHTWLAWAIGAVLAISLFYRGLPRVLKPDPSNALGIYLLCSMLILVLTALTHFLATAILGEKIFRSGFSV
jgi:hypothetical protein